MRLWHLHTGLELFAFKDVIGKQCFSVAFSPTGDKLVAGGTGGAGGNIVMWTKDPFVATPFVPVAENDVFAEKYDYGRGYFGRLANTSQWREHSVNGVFSFDELKRDAEMILLRDTSRHFTVEIPIRGGTSKLSADDGVTWQKLYKVRKE